MQHIAGHSDEERKSETRLILDQMVGLVAVIEATRAEPDRSPEHIAVLRELELSLQLLESRLPLIEAYINLPSSDPPDHDFEH
jgi:hypothetical protein